ncbi:MAG TPA: L-threonylcarbamoyladenylate synthase, partial [Ktedonobacteraceae bacterium]
CMEQQKQTEIVYVERNHPDRASIERAASLLRAGELVIFPTETVYGLGADALQSSAVERIFAAKGRPYSDPLIAHIADMAALDQLVTELPDEAYALARVFWPGPLTLILPASTHVPKMVTAGLSTVAVRMPSHPVAQALIRAARTPIAAPSANRFMHVSPTTAQHAFADLHGRVQLILDSGPCEVGVESTILDLCSHVPTILRPGGISLEALRSILPNVQPPARHSRLPVQQAMEAQKAPGQMLTHYSPETPAYLFEGTPEEIRAAMLKEVQQHRAHGEEVGLLITDEDIETFRHSGAHIYLLGKTAEEAATRLYAGLRVLEEARVQVILCCDFNEQGLGMAIRDRLLKATGGKVIRASVLP